MNRIFLDTEFTGLHQGTTLISLALYHSEDSYFYAEFNDYAADQITPWINDHVLVHLEYKDTNHANRVQGNTVMMKAKRAEVTTALESWLGQFDNIEIWADVLAYDWVLFCELFGGALTIPENIFFAPFDLATAFRLKGLINPKKQYEDDIDRYGYAGVKKKKQHNALEDARVCKICWEKILSS